MNYNLKTNGVAVTDEIRSYLEKRLSHLDKLAGNMDASRVDTDLSYIESEEKTFCTKLLLHAPGISEPLRAEATAGTLHGSIDAAVGELTRELTKTKKRKIHMLRHRGAQVKDFIRGWRNKI